LAIYAGLFVWPVARSFTLVFYEWSGRGPVGDFAGLVNVRRLWGDEAFRDAVGHSLLIFVVLVVATNTVSLALASLLNRPLRFRSVYRAIIVLPYVLSPLVVGFIWILILSPEIGLLNPALRSVGLEELERTWLADSRFALPWISVALAWQWNGLATLIFLAGFQGVRPELLEAARLDGANERQVFRHVVVPQLAPAFTIANVLAAIFALRAFDLVYVIGGPLGAPEGSTTVISTVIYGTAFGQTSFSSDIDMSYAMTQGIVQFLFVGAIALTLLLYFGKRERDAR
jgi:raffinose/stachyose/melibiose transport system permease protein